MRRRKRKYVLPKNLLLFLVLLFFGMGVGYAAFSGNVSVSGSMAFREARWSVHFDDETLETLNGSVNANSPKVTDTHITFDAVLENPGDFYEFTIDVINDGTFNALIEDFEVYPNLSSSQANYFEYTVTYSDGTPIQVGDALNVNQSETIRVRFRYKTLSNESLYPTISQRFNFSIGLHYIQGNGNVIRPEETAVYTWYDYNINLGSPIPSGVNTYDSLESAILNSPTYQRFSYANYALKLVIDENSLVSAAYVGVRINNIDYFFRPGGATYHSDTDSYDNDSIYYQSNQDVYNLVFPYLPKGEHIWINQNGVVDVGWVTHGCNGGSDGAVICMCDEC